MMTKTKESKRVVALADMVAGLVTDIKRAIAAMERDRQRQALAEKILFDALVRTGFKRK